MRPDPLKIQALMREAASTYIVPRFRNLKSGEIDEKTSPNDLVTLADIEAEAFLEQAFGKLYPSIRFMGEEKVHRVPKTLDLLKQSSDDYFVVDPVDGTNNFVAGDENFGLMVSFVRGGKVEQAYIYDILKDRFMTAVRGEGAFDDGRKIMMPTKPSAVIGFAKDVYDRDGANGGTNGGNPHGTRGQFNLAAGPDAKGMKWYLLRCSAHEYLHLVRGQERFYIAEHVKPWDHLAGSLIVREAGGVSAKWDGRNYQPSDLNASILCAATEQDWHDLHRQLLQPAIKPAKLSK